MSKRRHARGCAMKHSYADKGRLLHAVSAFEGVVLDWTRKQPLARVEGGPRMLIGELFDEFERLERGKGKGAYTYADAITEAEKAFGPLDFKLPGAPPAPPAAVTLLGFEGLDVPVPSASYGHAALAAVPVAGIWVIYGKARWARLNEARMDKLGGNENNATFDSLVPREDIEYGIAACGGVAVGTACATHPGDPHDPLTLFSATLRDVPDATWSHPLETKRGYGVEGGSVALAIEWMDSTGQKSRFLRV